MNPTSRLQIKHSCSPLGSRLQAPFLTVTLQGSLKSSETLTSLCSVQGPIVQQQLQQQSFSHAQGLPMQEMGAPAYRP